MTHIIIYTPTVIMLIGSDYPILPVQAQDYLNEFGYRGQVPLRCKVVTDGVVKEYQFKQL